MNHFFYITVNVLYTLGKRHLAQKQKHADNMLRKRFGVGLSESMTTKKEHFGVDEGFWLRNESKDKQQMYYKDPELKRVHDDKRYDLMKSNFKGAKNYDRGQFKENMKDLYCELCGVTVATRDIMESHKQVCKLVNKYTRVACPNFGHPAQTSSFTKYKFL